MREMLNQTIWRTGHSKRTKRAITSLGSNCNDHEELWGAPARIIASVLAPGVAAAQALTTLNKLGCWCWTAKQLNTTSAILNQMLTDVGSIRHGTLQNRAAIDFLLLAHGHGCEEFEGMCWMNLSDNSASIHKKLKQLQDNMNKLTVNDWGLDEWFKGWGITRWLKDMVKGILLVLVVIILLLCVIPCIIKLVTRLVEKTVKRVWLVQEEEEGGIV
ncbi:LOW QUALITY PROTEIN: uncharacterized protein LOC129046998 [Molothrus ater]|uniref:LOW QUALITY PROTEIN: uncharacterized protein LOC129046998 n=1 Tax=Molothrus ater TaxID=84834 RepID=UPI0023E7A605|nr:LOW QUALITY PROTEIN: uncharacterized protein LOC129046998 [Molothrus ater]